MPPHARLQRASTLDLQKAKICTVIYQRHLRLQKTGCKDSNSFCQLIFFLKPHLGHKLSIDSNAGAAVIVKAIAVAALLIGVQVYAASFGSAIPDQVQPLMQLPQLQAAYLCLTIQQPLSPHQAPKSSPIMHVSVLLGHRL